MTMIPFRNISQWWHRLVAIVAVALLQVSVGYGANLQDGRPGTPSGAGGGSGPGVIQVVPAYRQANKVAVVTVKGAIDLITLQSLERRFAEVMEQGFEAVVLEIDTPGGRVDAARDIEHLLKNDAPVNTVAWVNPNAFSAGTLLALACREIVVHPDATWGDCAPIQVAFGTLVNMPPAERAKMEAPLRADVVDSARRHGYDERLVEAFISVGVELWMLEKVDTGERIFVDAIEYEAIFGKEPPAQTPRELPQTTGSTPPPVKPWYEDRLVPEDLRDGGGVSAEDWEAMSSEERDAIEKETRRQVEYAQTVNSARPTLTSTDRDNWRLVTPIVSSKELLVIKAAETIDFGLATAVIRNDKELCDYFGTTNGDPARDLVRFDESWSEGLVRLLVSFWVRAILGVVFVIGLFLEASAPGLGVFGAIAGCALLVLIGAPYLAGMAQWWEILLIFAGLLLVGLEIFVIPGFGVAGISGVLCLLIGIVGSFVSGGIGTPEGQDELLTGVGATLAALFGAGVGVWLLSRHIYEFPIFSRLILSATTDSSSSTIEHSGQVAPVLGPAAGSMVEPGDEGVAETDLRPSGRARIDGRIYDVVTTGEYITSGTPVRVRTVDAFKIEVEQV